MGVWPACSAGLYDSDEEHFYYMNNCMKTDEGYLEYREKSISTVTARMRNFWISLAGKKIEMLHDTPTSHLIDPYRRWIMSNDDIKGLMKEGR